jgi:hypothetical protein
VSQVSQAFLYIYGKKIFFQGVEKMIYNIDIFLYIFVIKEF